MWKSFILMFNIALFLIIPGSGHPNLPKAKACKCLITPVAWAGISDTVPTPRTLTPLCLCSLSPLPGILSPHRLSVYTDSFFLLGLAPTRSPGSLPSCPPRLCIRTFPPCAMMAGGQDCVWGKADLTGASLGAIDI